jgi:hypothetical protein
VSRRRRATSAASTLWPVLRLSSFRIASVTGSDVSTAASDFGVDFHDAWLRYLPAVADVADVADIQQVGETAADVAPKEDQEGDVFTLFSKNGSLSPTEEAQQAQHPQHETPR